MYVEIKYLCVVIGLGLHLFLARAQVIELNSTSCGGWSVWSSWSPVSSCTTSCQGTQTRQRQRSCPDRRDVTQFDRQTFACGDNPVDGRPGQWSEWKEDRNCGAYCGAGVRRSTRSRACDNPVPGCGGRPCAKDSLREERFRPCFNFPCGSVCPEPFREYVSSYTPAIGFYVVCRNGAGYLRPCPEVTDWYDIRSSRVIGFNQIFSVCYGYRYG